MKTLDELLIAFADWIESSIPGARTLSNDTEGRTWLLKSLGYDKTLKLEDLSQFTDREDLNDLYLERYKEKDVQSRKGISALKLEISALHGFNRCFVQRYKGRMHYYRDDLSQKAARNMQAVAVVAALFEEFKKNLDA